jgi:cytochrome c oxidase cbb3-type subunit III
MICRLGWLLPAISLALWAQHETKEGEKAKHPFIGDLAAIEAGRQQFSTGCAGCHGPEGGGGRGPNLQDRGVWHPMGDEDMYKLIQKGQGLMPGANVSEADGWRLVAYVRSLTTPAFEMKAPGNPTAGQAIYAAQGCANCHAIQGRGGKLGPDLSNAGLKLPMPKIRKAIIDPDDAIAEGYQGVDVVLRSGERVRGVVKNRTNYTLQVQLANGTLRLLDVGTVEQMTLRQSTLMPTGYASKLSKTEMDDLVSYVAKQAAGVSK